MVDPIPDGYHTITPYLIVPDIQTVLDFVQGAFDAEVTMKINGPGGQPTHAEVRIGDSKVMMGQRPDGGTMPAMIYVYVTDTDATYQRAIAAGATSEMEPSDQFYGDRNAGVKDQAGNLWWIATHIEDVPPDELQRRAAEMHKP